MAGFRWFNKITKCIYYFIKAINVPLMKYPFKPRAYRVPCLVMQAMCKEFRQRAVRLALAGRCACFKSTIHNRFDWNLLGQELTVSAKHKVLTFSVEQCSITSGQNKFNIKSRFFDQYHAGNLAEAKLDS
jgi:hypothetical protein